MSKTKVINVGVAHLRKLGYSSLNDWIKDSKNVYIGRDMSFYVLGAKQSIWANPFSSKVYGLERCLELYEGYIRKMPHYSEKIESLRGCNLGCWCKPSKCHGDIITKLLEENLKC